jgi:hypothetical protein
VFDNRCVTIVAQLNLSNTKSTEKLGKSDSIQAVLRWIFIPENSSAYLYNGRLTGGGKPARRTPEATSKDNFNLAL